jgi:transposase
MPTAIVNPRPVCRFAEAMGSLEKTDRIDCAMVHEAAQVTVAAAGDARFAAQGRAGVTGRCCGRRELGCDCRTG